MAFNGRNRVFAVLIIVFGESTRGAAPQRASPASGDLRAKCRKLANYLFWFMAGSLKGSTRAI